MSGTDQTQTIAGVGADVGGNDQTGLMTEGKLHGNKVPRDCTDQTGVETDIGMVGLIGLYMSGVGMEVGAK